LHSPPQKPSEGVSFVWPLPGAKVGGVPKKDETDPQFEAVVEALLRVDPKGISDARKVAAKKRAKGATRKKKGA
jgi:hypothetical protein